MKYIVEKSINETIAKCHEGDTLFIPNGIYNEKVIINIKGLEIIGEDINNTIIRNHDYYHKIMSDYNECNTFRTFTVAIVADNVSVKNLTIENTSTPSRIYGQAVALHASANNLYFENIYLKSAQDTLFTGPLPLDLIDRLTNFLPNEFLSSKESIQIYKKCKIEGDVDFIFGCAVALFDQCTIISIDTLKRNPAGYVCAPAHYNGSKFGYLFKECDLISNLPQDCVYLARPWRDQGTACFIDCNYGKHICSVGFSNWSNTNRDKTAKFIEYSSKENLSNRIKWSIILNEVEKNQYIVSFMKYISKNK